MMMRLLEDIRLAMRQVWQSTELLETVLPVLLLGIALNVVALNVVENVRVEMGGQRAARTACEKSSPVQRVVAPLRKMIGRDQHRWCAAKGWVKERQIQVIRYRAEAGQMVYCALEQTSRC